MLSPELKNHLPNINFKATRRAVGGGLLAVLSAGCQLLTPDQTPSPVVSAQIPESVPTTIPATPRPTFGERYDQFRSKLEDVNMPIYYRSLIGSDVFETREDFLANNRGRDLLPQSVAFSWGDGRGTQIAYGAGFLTDAVIFLEGREGTTRGDFCAPGSDSKRGIYRGLVEEFEQGAEVDKRLLQALMAGMTPDCNYFIEVDTRTAPRNAQEVRQRG